MLSVSGQEELRREQFSTSRRLIVLLHGLEDRSGICDLTSHGFCKSSLLDTTLFSGILIG
jgi:hypothetical protein